MKEKCLKCTKKFNKHIKSGDKDAHWYKITHLIEDHLVWRQKEKYLKCTLGSCERDLRKKSKEVPMPALSKSATRPTPEDTTIFKCFGCKKILKTKEQLDKHSHVYDRHLTTNPWFKCSICNAVFSTVIFLNQHVVFKHQENLKAV